MNRSKRRLRKKAKNRKGVLTFEWILLLSLLVIGIIGGLSSVRNALLSELDDLAACIRAIDLCDTDEPAP